MWYLGYVHGGKSRVAGKTEREFNQFIVEQELRAMGIECWCGRKIEFKRTGKQRRPEPHERPYLLNYIFADIPAHLVHKAVQVKHLAPTLMPLNTKDLNGTPKTEVHAPVYGFRHFRQAVDAEYEEASRIKANQELVAEYVEGQALQYIGVGFGDTLMRFKSLIERAGDLHPKIKAEMEMMGRVVTIEVDPLSVRAAE